MKKMKLCNRVIEVPQEVYDKFCAFMSDMSRAEMEKYLCCDIDINSLSNEELAKHVTNVMRDTYELNTNSMTEIEIETIFREKKELGLLDA